MRKNFRKTVFLIAILACLAFVPVVSATEFEDTEYAFGNYAGDGHYLDVHPSDTNDVSAYGQAINITDGGYLTKFAVDLATYSDTYSAEGYFVAKVYAGTGVFGTNMTPTGAALAVSTNQIDFSNDSIANFPSHEQYNFTFDGTVYLTAGEKYCFSVEVASATVLDGSRFPMIGMDQTSPTATGNSFFYYYYLGRGWYGVGGNSQELVYEVYLDNIFGGGVTEDPFDPGTWTDPTDVITAVTSFLVPLTVVLIPVFLLTYLGGKTKWMVLIGLVIGIGLGFYFGFVPLWLVFLITIGIIGMAYQSVRSGGDS